MVDIELGQVLLERDFSLKVEYNQSTGNGLSRAELEDIVQHVLGQPVPNNDVCFLVKTLDDKYFKIDYVKAWDKFIYKKEVAR